MSTIKSSSWQKLYLMVLLGITTGARKGEIKRLKWKDVDLEKRVAYTGITKNGDRKTTALLPKVIDELKKYRAQPNQYIFASERIPTQPYSFDKVWLKAVKDAKIKDFHFHDLRHSGFN
jgi:integrase